MPWPFSESIKKRACRYLLHRYLDHFLEEKLSLEQLSVDLYQGTGSLAQVPLDKSSLNEILESLDAPVEMIEGFIQKISVSIPWSSLLQENCAVEVQGLEMVFRPRPRIVSGSEPMYWSSFMTDSMQLAKECLNQRLTDDQAEGSQPFEGLEKFAETIETVLRRVKLTFIDSVLRIEHVPENSKTGVALEIHIQRIEYCDESATECPDVSIHLPTAFAHKNLQMGGISLFWFEFPESARTSPRVSPMQEMEPKLSPSWNPKIVSEPHPQFTRKASDAVHFDPVQIGSCEGKMELELTLRQNEAHPVAKLDVKGQIESMKFFLSPQQVHLLLDMISTILLPGCTEATVLQSKSRRNRPMQQEDQYLIQMELNRCLQKDTASPGISAEQSYYETETVRTTSSRAEDDVFFSMADMEMSNSVTSLPPLGEPTVDMELSLSSTHVNSPDSSPQSATGFSTSWDDYLDRSGPGGRIIRESPFNSKELPIIQRPLRSSSLLTKSHPIDESRPEVVIRLVIGSLSVSVLHIDPLPPPESPLHLEPLTRMASHFFEHLKTLDLSQFPAKDFHVLRNKFATACPHDHLWLFATSMKLNYEQRRGTSSRSLSTDVCINWMELLECLFPMDFPTSIPQYTELITFQSVGESEAQPVPPVQIHYKHVDRRGVQGSQGRLTSVPQKADLQIELGLIHSELDISIVDRLNSLLQPQNLATTEMMASHMYTSFNKHINLQRAFTEVFRDDSGSPANYRMSMQLTTPMFKMAIRFPIPDLRSDQERGPWFKKSLQKEILHLEFSELEFKTEFCGSLSHEQLKLELTFKELLGKLQEDLGTPSFTFIKVLHGADGDLSASNSGKFDWPRVVLKVNPTAVHSILERITSEEEEAPYGSPLLEEDEEGGGHSLKDVCDLGKWEPSPFSSRRVMYENEEMVMPGDQLEMGQFQDKTMSTSHYVLELMLPNVSLALPSKAFYEKVYNRINNLLLWEPAAPSPVETVENVTYGVGLSVASQMINAFSKESLTQLKSALLQDDEESGSDDESLQFQSTVDPVHRSRRKKKVEQLNKNCQSLLSILLNVSHGLVTVHTDTKSEDGTVLAGKHSEFWLEIENGSMFTVGKYQGCDDQHYFCLQTNKVFLCHQGVVEDVGDVNLPSNAWPQWLEPTIYPSEEGVWTKQAATSVGSGIESPNMLSIAAKVHHNKSESNMKEILVAIGVRGATLQYRNVPPGQGWHEQILDFLNIAEEPVLGYSRPANATTFHLHLWSCALDYRPLYLPVRAIATVETFTISSNILLDKNCSTLRIIIDDAALYLSEKCHNAGVNLKKDYVRVLDMGLLEFRITASKPTEEEERLQPRFELRCSSDVIHVRTCSDSCAALMNLIQYVASYGDLHPPCKFQGTPRAATHRNRVGSGDSTACRPSGLAEAEQKLLRDLMIDAMEETVVLPSLPPPPSAGQQSDGIYRDLIQEREPARSDLFLFPDESGGSSQEQSPSSTMALPEQHSAYTPLPSEQPESEDFCILDAPKLAVTQRETEPVVRMLVSGPILVKNEHFASPVKKMDKSKAPLHLPIPETRYAVKEISVVWHLYGGRDFGTAVTSRSPIKNIPMRPGSRSSHSLPSQPSAHHSHSTRRVQGGPGRNHNILMEIQFSKVKFQHEVYPQTDHSVDPGSAERPISRQVLIIQDLEIRDRLATSQMNKFLYLYSSKDLPRKAHANMLTVKALHVSPDSIRMPQECCLRVTLMPLRLNIDQDALFFLKAFFSSLAAELELLIPPDPVQEVRKSPGVDATSNLSKNEAGAVDHSPIITLPGQRPVRADPLTVAARTSINEPEGTSSTVFGDQPIFFREFRFTSEVPIRLDYHGKHMSMDQGTLAGILIGLAQLNCSELKLKRLCNRHGLLGVDRLISYALNEWLTDIRKYQLPGILGGVGPMHSLVQLVQGLKDLVWLPIEQYRRDGHIVRGLQRGAASFGTSTAMAALELTNRLVQTIQAAAETAYDMVSPGSNSHSLMRSKRISQHRLTHQPVDLREGVAKAYDLVKEGFTDTAQMIYETATREHEERGMTGAVGGVLRQIPPTVVKPLIVATEATSNVLGGMRNQIQPDARQEESQKWRLGDQ
ncbi:autophagy-related protein 2 homolog B-like isoform X4 [Narcine bancroftii]|uniref:autophagy-related protein 2 homolog B-like isoform X4 n=1 Tax=Narcine bancroftii TaxID=1343680 RepID=UPI003831BC37